MRLPDSLFEQLSSRAKAEGKSRNEYVVSALARLVALDELAEQRARFERLRKRVTDDEAESSLQALLDSRV